MELTQTQRKLLYIWCIEDGLSINYGRLSLCDLRNFRHSSIRYNRKYQVHCDDKRYPYSKIYEDLDSAVSKFMEIKLCVKKKS